VTWPDPVLDDGAADDFSPSDVCDLCFAWCAVDLPDPVLADPELLGPEPDLPDPELLDPEPEPDEPVDPDVLDVAAVVCALPGSA
jgi:hypothetical protein